MASMFSVFKRGEGLPDIKTFNNPFQRLGKYSQCYLWGAYFNDMQGQLKKLDAFEQKYHSGRFRLAPIFSARLFRFHWQFMEANKINLNNGDHTPSGQDCTISAELVQFMTFFKTATEEITSRYEQFESK